jgi:hypothetical protein
MFFELLTETVYFKLGGERAIPPQRLKLHQYPGGRKHVLEKPGR